MTGEELEQMRKLTENFPVLSKAAKQQTSSEKETGEI